MTARLRDRLGRIEASMSQNAPWQMLVGRVPMWCWPSPALAAFCEVAQDADGSGIWLGLSDTELEWLAAKGDAP